MKPELVSRVLPGVEHDRAHWEALYPPRDLPAEAEVTRFAPSPTGNLHIGGVYVAMVARSIAHATGGTYFVRVEDTDQARLVTEAQGQFDDAFAYFSIASDEDEGQVPWGPYRQSDRGPIYLTYAAELLAADRAYPCFCTKEDLDALRERQMEAGVATGYHGEWATCSTLTEGEVEARLDAGTPAVVRFRPPADGPERSTFVDAIRGEVDQASNVNHAVLIKSTEPRLPTYHLAHAVDDHLMRVSLVIRGDEWLSSVPLHLQLFAALGHPAPTYAHVAPLMKVAGSSRRKLSKRKDPEASVGYYMDEGYPVAAVHHYLRGLANADLADLPPAEAAATPLRLDRFGVAGPLVDLAKLDDIAQDVIADMTAADVHAEALRWAQAHDGDLAAALFAEEDRAIAAFGVGRGLDEPIRKDLVRWSQVREVSGFYLDGLFAPVTDPADERFGEVAPEVVAALAEDFADALRPFAGSDDWFDQVRELAARHRFAPNKAALREGPEAYVGLLKDAAGVVRVLITGSTRSPELDRVVSVLGLDVTRDRLRAVLD